MSDNPRAIIRPIAKVSDEEKATKKPPEMRVYLICYYYTDGTTSWTEVIGRTEAYDNCKTNIEAGDVDVERSIVLVEGGKFGEHATLYQFMKHMEKFYDSENHGARFDIEDYVVGDSEDELVPEYGNTDYDIHTPINVTSGVIEESEDI